MNELTREHILSMPAGRELDMLVATNVFLLVESPVSLPAYPKVINPENEMYSMTVKGYSTDIAAAWEVVWKMNERGYRIVLYGLEEGYEVYFESETEEFFHAPGNESESISKAALLAVMGL